MKGFQRSGSILLILLLALVNILQCFAGSQPEYFLHEKETSSTDETGNFLGQQEFHDCYIIVKETKRIGGQCVKITDNVQGCVAGKLMYPLHHDCM